MILSVYSTSWLAETSEYVSELDYENDDSICTLFNVCDMFKHRNRRFCRISRFFRTRLFTRQERKMSLNQFDKVFLFLGGKGEKMNRSLVTLLTTTICILFGCASDQGKVGAIAAEKDYSKDQIRTLLSFDAILAIKNPQFVSASEAKLDDEAPIIGVSFNGEHHAYSIYLLNGHEIVNDVVGGLKIATTW